MMHSREDNHEGRIISATIVEKTGMVCIYAHIQEGTLEMAKEEVIEDKSLHPKTGPKHLLNPSHKQLQQFHRYQK